MPAETLRNLATQQVIDQRLDAIDRALLGLLPRADRLAVVSQVETKIQGLAEGDLAGMSPLERGTDALSPAGSNLRAPTGRRSRLALSSGVMGIISLVLMIGMPFGYVLLAMIGEGFDETFLYGLLGLYLVAVAVGGLLAVIFGIAGLVRIARRKGKLLGHGWAITGLCTGPLPMMVGCLLVASLSLALLGGGFVSVQSVNGVTPAGYAAPSDPPEFSTAESNQAPIRNAPRRISEPGDEADVTPTENGWSDE